MSSQTTSRIWVQLLKVIAVALVVVWALIILWQGYTSRQAALEQAQDFSLSMHNATMAGLTGMMVTGTVAQRDVFLDQIKQLGVWAAETFGTRRKIFDLSESPRSDYFRYAKG